MCGRGVDVILVVNWDYRYRFPCDLDTIMIHHYIITALRIEPQPSHKWLGRALTPIQIDK